MTVTKLDLPHNFDKDRCLQKGQETLDIEAEGLKILGSTLLTLNKESFTKAVDVILQTKGRVVITGMGKSGHIGNKIAATLSSTGTPSFFVHPGEASHGDLGMITPQDTVIAMSNSGETSELSDVLAFAKRHLIPLIAFTSKGESTLATLADIALVLPLHKEACPHGMAPTTSSTMMMALGDALAMSTLDARSFTAKDFGSLHPGGKLGQRLLRVESIMHKGTALPLIDQSETMQNALLEMTSKGFGCVGIKESIVKDDALVGVITDGDLRRHMGDQLLSKTVKEIMSHGPKTISKDALAVEALALMNETGITCIFVTEETGTRPIGILHIHDCLRAGLS